MPDSGPLETQQRIAAQIPYQNIEQYDKKLRTAVSAWIAGSEVTRKQQQLENQLQLYQLRSTQQETANRLREAALENAIQKSEWQRNVAEEGRRIQSERVGLFRDKLEGAADLKIAQAEAQAGLSGIHGQLAVEGIEPWTKEFVPAYWRHAEPYMKDAQPGVFKSTAGQILTEHNQAVTQKRLGLQIAEKSVKDNVGDQVWEEYGRQDLTPVLQPELFPKWKEKVPGTGWFGTTVGATTKETNDIELTVKDRISGQPVKKRVSMKVLNDLKKQWEAVQKEKARVGDYANVPELGVYAPDLPRSQTMRDRATQIAQDPNASSQAKMAAEKYLRENP